MFDSAKRIRNRNGAKYALWDVICLFEPLNQRDGFYSMDEIVAITGKSAETLKEYISAAKKYGVLEGYSKNYRLLPAWFGIKSGAVETTFQAITKPEIFGDVFKYYGGINFPDKVSIASYINKKFDGVSMERAMLMAQAFLHNVQLLESYRKESIKKPIVVADASKRKIPGADERLVNISQRPNSTFVEIRTESGILIGTLETFYRLSDEDRKIIELTMKLL